MCPATYLEDVLVVGGGDVARDGDGVDGRGRGQGEGGEGEELEHVWFWYLALDARE